MAEERGIESILVADCGTVYTKVLLLEKVESSFRFVAQAETLTTANPPWNDMSVGVVHAVEDLERTTGRTIFARGRLIIPRQGIEGVDQFVVVMSAPQPLRVVLAGLIREMSLESARRAACGTYTEIEAALSREGSLKSPQESWSRTVRDLAPDVVVLVGGVDGGASRPVMELADAVALAASMLEKEQRPIVLYAGNAALRQPIAKLMGDITRVEVADNVHPTADTEHLGPAQTALESLYVEHRIKTAPGAETLAGWSHRPIIPTATAFSRVVEYLWHREGNRDRGVLGIDAGAATTTVAATFDGHPYVSIYPNGIAQGPLDWLKDHSLDEISRWLPEEMSPDELLAMLHNRALHPWTTPQDAHELWVEQAVAREMLQAAIKTAQPSWNTRTSGATDGTLPRLDPILISGGGLVHMPRPGQALLTILDGVQPTGIATVLLDVNRAAPAIGAVAGVKPVAAASSLEAGTLVPLGTVISPIGRAHQGDVIMRIHIAYEDGGELEVEAHYGDIEIWPLLPGQQATLTLKPNRRFDVGLGVGRGGKVKALGGIVGLVFDGRGRPLMLPEDPDRRRRLLNGWIWDVGG